MDRPAVLLLERDATIIDVARACFLVENVELHVANSVDLAVRIASRRPLVVAVLDATMAGAVPGETVMKLKAFHHALRIVFLADPGVVVDRRHSQLGLVLRKPFTAERFGDTVRSALRLQSMSAGVQRMRHSSGTYASVHMSEPAPGGLPSLGPSTPPGGLLPVPSPSTPPAGIRGIGAGLRAPGSIPPPPFGPIDVREEDAPARRPRDRKAPIPREEPPEPPSSPTPRPFQRAKDAEPPRSLTPRPFPRVQTSSEPPRSPTPRPFAAVKTPTEPPRSLTPRPFARVR